ncbi:MAG TPA: hypothetical protein PLZ51_08855 [Aggregatilineales bacterium]|nr:hypothetical protein [Aggregatilineales bacterium]
MKKISLLLGFLTLIAVFVGFAYVLSNLDLGGLFSSGVPEEAKQVVFRDLARYGGENIVYQIISEEKAPYPQNHWNPLINDALEMWCVVINPPSEIKIIDRNNYRLKSFLVYRTNRGWFMTNGISIFHADEDEFVDVGCTNFVY